MPLRQIMPEPYQLTVFPVMKSTSTNPLGNKTLTMSNQTQPVTRGATSLRVSSTKEIINPAYLDRVVTRVRLATTDLSGWAEGDLVELPNGMGTYQMEGDPEVDNCGPLTFVNHLFGGVIRLKRVN